MARLVGEAARLVSQALGGDELEMRVSHPTVTVFLDRRGSSTVAVAVEAKHKVASDTDRCGERCARNCYAALFTIRPDSNG